MTSRFFLGAYWDARRESADDCAVKVSRLLNGMATIDPALSHWFERGRSRKDALTRTVDYADPSRLQTLLLKGRNRYDEGGGVIDDLGFNLGLWNGAMDDDGEASLSVHCGSFNDRVGNNVLLDLPMQSRNLGDAKSAAALLALVAETWQPQWAGIMSKRAIVDRDFDADYPFVDWMVYVPRVINAAPSFATVIPLAGLGSIVVVQPEPPQGNDPEELRRIGQVEAVLSA
ncbi:hypothetical protein PbB2_02412 [Candidatus Phycosocius bacilliformis]|uniref:Immunity protein 52 domain-containing protein n=1 Tax=Candidatus Phycosocius bacilliformis TaxID=1445552 RepID=A0A2P2ECF8_9PROT|nr:Imm52 family immunity protein [Candidatus Phycosocius bacilliformis]GBF58724.1 hypothetical protein PbB2_02412 [Candidatus Phycosocius bacilliformis]